MTPLEEMEARAVTAERRCAIANKVGAELIRRIEALNREDLLMCLDNWAGRDGGGIMQPRCWHECGKVIGHVGTHRCRRCGEDG